MNWQLKSLVVQTGKHQWKIAQELGWPENKLSRFVTGRMVPTQVEAEELAKVLGISPEKLQEAIKGDQ